MRDEAPPAIGLRVGAGLLACLCVAGGCADAQRGNVGPADKVRFDLGAIGADGLEGPPDGRRAVDYEFCVPAEEAVVAALATLPSLDELRGKLVGLLQAPATKIAGVLAAPGGQLARVLNAYATKDAA